MTPEHLDPSFPGPRLDWDTLSIRHGAQLPHWNCEAAIYHLTFRLVDSVPRSVCEAWMREREAIVAHAASLKRELSEDEENRLRNLYRDKIEAYLDAGHGACHLKHAAIAPMVSRSLTHFHRQRYRLHAWALMPNHAHAVVQPFSGWSLGQIAHSWKSYTAHQANKILGLEGAFWQEECYDHIIRNEREYQHQLRYVWENPDKAGLKNWPWRGMPE